MLKRILGLGAVAVAALLASVAIAQVPSLIIASPTGAEQVDVLVPSTTGVVISPQKTQVTINQIRNSTGYALVATGTTVSYTVPNTASNVITTGAVTTLNLTLPTAPEDSQLVSIACPGGNIGTLSVSASAPTGVAITGASATSCTQSTPTHAQWQYSSSANVWYRVE